ncbi:MAG: FAD-dependent thymidylate synthase [Elusimicrobiota bacterium]
MEVRLTALTPEAEKLIESSGRTCYMSRHKMTDNSHSSFIKKLIKAGHLSVLEHACATFNLSGVSRALTHQLVRHRLCSFSQRSQRYVKEEEFAFVTPPSIEKNKKTKEMYDKSMGMLFDVYSRLLNEGVSPQDARFVLPNACPSTIVFSANFRQLRHMIELRGASKAQWEIRELFIKIAKLLKKEAPSCFYDFKIDENKRIVYKDNQEE